MNSVHFEAGNNKIAFVFSCPGKDEESFNPPGPAKGQTGENLEVVLQNLSNTYPLEGFTREEIVITNAWSNVEYEAKTNRSEATCSEITKPDNLERLLSEVKNIKKYIVTCGEKAELAINTLFFSNRLSTSVIIVRVAHLGNQGINSTISEDIEGYRIQHYKKSSEKPAEENRSLKEISKDNRLKRLAVVAQGIKQQISASNAN